MKTGTVQNFESVEVVPPDESHAGLWHIWRQDPEAKKYNPFAPATVEELNERLSKSKADIGLFDTADNFIWAIKHGNEIVGNVSLQNINRMMLTAEIGYIVSLNSRGKGCASGSVRHLINLCFERTPLRKLIAYVHENNLASRRVLEKIGFRQEGLLRDHYLIAGQPANEVVYGLLRSESCDQTPRGDLSRKLHEWRRDQFLISTDQTILDLNAIHQFLSKKAYWSIGIPSEVVSRAMTHSLCFGLFLQTENLKQIGFARIVTDQATFAWICDVYVEEDFRGKGIAQWLMSCIMAHPALQNLRRVCLATKDAHALYEKLGFSVATTPGNWMEIKDNEIYRKLAAQGATVKQGGQ